MKLRCRPSKTDSKYVTNRRWNCCSNPVYSECFGNSKSCICLCFFQFILPFNHCLHFLFQVTNQMLCEYFRQFGAIERVQILPERIRLLNLLPAVDLNSVANALDNSPDCKYFAYVTFVNCLGAYDASMQNPHKIQDQRLCVDLAFSWHQPNVEIETVMSEKQKQNPNYEFNRVIFTAMHQSLNDDCIIKIMSYLNTFFISEMAKFNGRFQSLAQTAHRRLTIVMHSMDWNDHMMTLMDFRSLLRLQGFGQTITTLKLSINAFSSIQRASICSRLTHYIGPQLRSLTLLQFGITTDQFRELKPLLLQLNYLDIDLNYEFDYNMFNDSWPNLLTLRIKSVGLIQLVGDANTERVIEFPNVHSLLIVTSYRLYEALFNVIAKHFPTLNELAVVNIDDYYTELTVPTGRIDLQQINELNRLRKLHLSLSKMYLNDTVLSTLIDLPLIEHFTLEFSSGRNSSGELNVRNLIEIICGMPEMTTLRLSGIQLNDQKIVEIYQKTANLVSLSIHNNNFTLSLNAIDNLYLKIKAKQLRHPNTAAFELIVDQFQEDRLYEVRVLTKSKQL